MAKVPTVATETWRRLFEAALSFRNLAPWAWMDDGQVFGVVDPLTGDTFYCCVLGAGRQIYGFVAYRGTAGYAVHLKMQRLGGRRPDPDIGLEQDVIFSEFTTADELEEPDVEIQERLGLKFRGG